MSPSRIIVEKLVKERRKRKESFGRNRWGGETD